MLYTGNTEDKKQGEQANEEREEVKAVIWTIKWKEFQPQQGFSSA